MPYVKVFSVVKVVQHDNLGQTCTKVYLAATDFLSKDHEWNWIHTLKMMGIVLMTFNTISNYACQVAWFGIISRFCLQR